MRRGTLPAMAPDLDTVLATADAGLSLAERLARLFKRDPATRAARMLARAGRLNARSITANPKRAARLRAQAAALVAAAETLNPRPR